MADIDDPTIEVDDAEQILRQLEELVTFVGWIRQHFVLSQNRQPKTAMVPMVAGGHALPRFFYWRVTPLLHRGLRLSYRGIPCFSEMLQPESLNDDSHE